MQSPGSPSRKMASPDLKVRRSGSRLKISKVGIAVTGRAGMLQSSGAMLRSRDRPGCLVVLLTAQVPLHTSKQEEFSTVTSPPLPATAQQSLGDAVRRHFAVPDQAAASMILAALEPVACRGGDWLFRQGDEGDALYLLARGRLQAWIDAAEPGAGGQRLLAEIGPGEIVGEIGMLAGGQRSASIRAVRDSLLLRMDAAAFDQLGRQRPELIRHIAGGIAARLRDRTAGPAPAGRPVRTIALVPLDGPASAEALAPRLLDALAPKDRACS